MNLLNFLDLLRFLEALLDFVRFFVVDIIVVASAYLLPICLLDVTLLAILLEVYETSLESDIISEEEFVEVTEVLLESVISSNLPVVDIFALLVAGCVDLISSLDVIVLVMLIRVEFSLGIEDKLEVAANKMECTVNIPVIQVTTFFLELVSAAVI